jgi:RNA polymerase sigma-70 factor (ECF subfamily)
VDAQVVLSAVQRMDENLRLPLTLFYLKNFKYREIADVLKIPIGTVMSRLARAKAQLRADLGITPNSVPAL